MHFLNYASSKLVKLILQPPFYLNKCLGSEKNISGWRAPPSEGPK